MSLQSVILRGCQLCHFDIAPGDEIQVGTTRVYRRLRWNPEETHDQLFRRKRTREAADGETSLIPFGCECFHVGCLDVTGLADRASLMLLYPMRYGHPPSPLQKEFRRQHLLTRLSTRLLEHFALQGSHLPLELWHKVAEHLLPQYAAANAPCQRSPVGVDDLFSEGSSIRTFAHRFGTHEAQGHPSLDCLARLLRVETPKLFGPFGTNIIITATLDGINGSTLETLFPRVLPKSMPGFSSWQRTWTGYSLAYGCFIFPDAEFPESEFLGRYVQIKPSLRDVISFVNDILSFYKERLLAKEVCLISNLAQEKSISDLASLKLVCDSALSLDKDIRQFLAGDRTVLGAYVGFLLGYLEWHFRVDRYHLEELGLTLS